MEDMEKKTLRTLGDALRFEFLLTEAAMPKKDQATDAQTSAARCC
jgi:hypothetical protein